MTTLSVSNSRSNPVLLTSQDKELINYGHLLLKPIQSLRESCKKGRSVENPEQISFFRPTSRWIFFLYQNLEIVQTAGSQFLFAAIDTQEGQIRLDQTRRLVVCT